MPEPARPVPYERFPRGFDEVANGYVATRPMADGRLWGLLRITFGRLRIVVIEDEWSAGEHY